MTNQTKIPMDEDTIISEWWGAGKSLGVNVASLADFHVFHCELSSLRGLVRQARAAGRAEANQNRNLCACCACNLGEAGTDLQAAFDAGQLLGRGSRGRRNETRK